MMREIIEEYILVSLTSQPNNNKYRIYIYLVVRNTVVAASIFMYR